MLKKFQAALKAVEGAEDQGSVKCVFSTFGVIDRDGDIVLPGALKDGTPVTLCSWGHKWGDLPVGKGVIKTTEQEAIFEGSFFLNTEAGRETYETVKAMGDLQQWSWGFSILPGGSYKGERDGKRVNYITAVEPYEVSPVLVGSNPVTSTIDIKSAEKEDTESTEEETDTKEAVVAGNSGEARMATCQQAQSAIRELMKMELDDECASYVLSELLSALRLLEYYGYDVQYSMAYDAGDIMSLGKEAEAVKAVLEGFRKLYSEHKEFLVKHGISLVDADQLPEEQYAEHGDRLLADLSTFANRSKSLADLRAKEGRTLSTANRNRLVSLVDSMKEAMKEIEALLDETAPKEEAEASEDGDEEAKKLAAELATKKANERARRLRLARLRMATFEEGDNEQQN